MFGKSLIHDKKTGWYLVTTCCGPACDEFAKINTKLVVF